MAAIHHLALRTHDVERLVAFYREWFELEVARDRRPRSVWLALGSSAVLMIERAEPSEPSLDPASLELHAFAISEAARVIMRERLQRAQLLEAETQYTLYFRDPDGRRVAASCYPLGEDARETKEAAFE